MDVITAPDREHLRAVIETESGDSRLISQLRRTIGDEWTDAALTSARLQRKAIAKFGGGLWWCTERSLAQATPREVANLKASWIGAAEVWDLCCGIGGDAVAIADREASSANLLIAVDRDPMIAAMAAANLQTNSRAESSSWRVRCQDVDDAQPPREAVLHIDPDRREHGRRTTRPQDYAPPWPVVQRLIDRCAGAIVKLAPATELVADGTGHRMWISLRGSVREQSLLVGDVVQRASTLLGTALTFDARSAVVLSGGGASACFVGDVRESVDRVTEPSAFMVDPDAAIRAAGLTEAFAADFALAALGGPAGFLTGSSSPPDSLSIAERVVWYGSADDRKLRKTLRSMDAFPWRVKARGVSHHPNELERRYRQCGQRPMTLWIGKNAQRHYAVLTETA